MRTSPPRGRARWRWQLAVLLVAGTGLSCQQWLATPPPAPRDAAPLADFAPPAVLDVEAAIAGEPDADARSIASELLGRHTGLGAQEILPLARLIVAEARGHGLEPALVMAVIEVESSGYHMAVSSVGALGLMQLLPSTAEEVAGELGIPWHGPDTLFDPYTNVRLGTAYLRHLADRYRGDVSMALAAYNWGPGRIDGRLRRGHAMPRRYVSKVMTAYDLNSEVLAGRS